MPLTFARIHQCLLPKANQMLQLLSPHVGRMPPRQHLPQSMKLQVNTTQEMSQQVTRTLQPKEATNICNDTSVSTAQSESKIAVAPRPCRLGAAKSYTHDHSDGAESSPSDSNWAADEEKHKKAARPSAVDGDDNSDDPSLSPLRLTHEQKGKGRAKAFDKGDNDEQDYNEEQEVNEDKSDKGPAKKGRLPFEVVLKVQELGARVILIEVGLATKATRKESPWNQHQTWFKTFSPPSQESAGYWYHTHGIHISGVAIFPGYEDAGHQASGYKDLEAAQAEGISFSFLPRSTTGPNGTLLCNGKSARDRNRKVTPMIISEKFAEAGHPLKTSNNRWLDILNTLYVEQLFILNWPAVVPPPGPNFDLKALSADLGQDDEDDDSEAETAKTKKCKGKSKKSNHNRRTKGTIVEKPDVVLSIREWSEYTNGEVLRELRNLVKFFKNFPLPYQASTNQMILQSDAIVSNMICDTSEEWLWFVGNKKDQDSLFGAQGASIVSPGAKEVTPNFSMNSIICVNNKAWILHKEPI
ncbi:uncharacterized protein F5891DRAFT_976551 [Suillus fuscotomentosus]|uniref:Uncharacterized protein n=1 Tax=Suillus fuscotomentosus TaxID=1912939 RepID=A0AAD4EEW3_9AGAM|nr:uncharacterized protein F5891DRAFT_976551 [Suillus fuscotomentosus]KAG1904973.1 hypothetical protein F5891DRAFT_976551 [Suillus fuscotomentosus]